MTAVPVTLPWKATLCLTYVCNLRCGFCSIWERRPKGELTAAEWDTILAKAPRFLWVDLTGGEPFARTDFYEILESVIVRQKPRLVHFPTNGSFPARLDRLPPFARRTKLMVTVSIDGPRALHDKMRGVDGSWDKAVESLRRLRAMPQVGVVAGLTLTAENEAHVEETVRELATAVPGFTERDLHVNLAQVSEHYYGNSTADFREAHAIPRARVPIWPPAAFAAGLVERRYRALLPRFLETRRCPMPCRSLSASVFISPMGLVHPCITDERVVGDLRAHDYDLRAVLSSPRAQELRDDVASGRCPHCWTPCEANPTILDSLPGARTAINLL